MIRTLLPFFFLSAASHGGEWEARALRLSEAARAGGINLAAQVRARSGTLAQRLSRSAAAVAARARPGVVAVLPGGRENGMYSGFIVDPAGLVLAPRKEVQPGQRLILRLQDGRRAEGTVLEASPDSEKLQFALIRLDGGRRDWHALPLGDDRLLRTGHLVIAVGAPMGFGDSVTFGAVSRLYTDGLIQAAIAVNPSSEGGPLLAMDGSVTGMVAAWAPMDPNHKRRGGAGSDGIGMAIPMERLKAFLGGRHEAGGAPRAAPMDPEAARFNLAMEHLAEEAARAVVGFQLAIEERLPSGGIEMKFSSGAGFFADPSGVVVTANHVVENAAKIELLVRNGGAVEKIEGKVLRQEPKKDLALVQAVSDRKDWPALPLGDSKRLRPGELVVTIGSPHHIPFSFSHGIVSGLDREVSGLPFSVAFVQTDAALNPGNSGGALMDAEGNAVGVVSNIIATAISMRSDGIGFAVPIEHVRELLREQGVGLP